MDSPDTSVADAAGHAPDARLPRRLVGAGLLGLAGSLLPTLGSRVGASAPPDGAATTTTAPPQRPTTDDEALLGFAQSVELAAVALYDQAIAAGGLSDEVATVVGRVRESHQAYAQALSALLGRAAPGTALEAVVSELSEGFSSGSDAGLAAAAMGLENTAVATHGELVGQLLGTDGAALIASILIVEAHHATALADIAGETELDSLLLSDAEALAPEKG